MAGSFTYRARKNDFYIKRLDKDGKMVRIASLRPSSSCLESLFRLLPMSFSRIFRLSRSACVVLAADALAPVVEGWFVIFWKSPVSEEEQSFERSSFKRRDLQLAPQPDHYQGMRTAYIFEPRPECTVHR
jgi:hypothetical protein